MLAFVSHPTDGGSKAPEPDFGSMEQHSDRPEVVVRRLYAARRRDDLEELRRVLHPDVVWREPDGRAPYAGTHHGVNEVLHGVHERTKMLTDGTFRLELDDVRPHGPMAVALVRWSATRNGRPSSGREVAVYRVAGGRVTEAAFHLDDREATDLFFS